MSGGDVPLTELCAICHVEPLKYTCPRCGIHTCSLACVKRHKQWAQCSGVRDPAAYRKRNELATPTSIDQDFNFITKVERSLERAGDDVTEKGIQLTPAGAIGRKGAGLGAKYKFDSEVAARRIKLVRTPQGMSRSKMNKSHWAGPQKGIMWTVEWIRDNGNRRETNVVETKTIADAYINCFGRRGLQKKRKRSIENDLAQSLPKEELSSAPSSKKSTAELHEPGITEQYVATESVDEIVPENAVDPTSTASKINPPSGENPDTGGRQNTSSILPERSKVGDSMEGIYFYLQKPLTRSKLKCLIPISAIDTFQDVLKNKTLLDFPTIYVREEAPTAIKEPYILEQNYSEEHKMSTSNEFLGPLADDDLVPSPTEVKVIDKGKILEVLKADLGT